ncbi:MAG: hypothetical protein MUC93_05770 [Bacteroidales bacterium]|jgi:hypothetical protein|nr:hypothetical protein [Bacteroidales bacterium]
MSETNNKKDMSYEEIDLSDLFHRIGKAIGRMSRALGRALLVSIVFLLKHWLPVGISIFLGIGTAYLLRMTSPSFYTSDLVLRINSAPELDLIFRQSSTSKVASKLLLRANSAHTADMISYINRLHKYCMENNRDALADAIFLTDEQVENLIDINALWIIDKGDDGIPDLIDLKDNHNLYDTVNVRMQDRVNIRVMIKSPEELVNVKTGLIKFINSDSLFHQRNRGRLKHNQELHSRFEYDIQQLDSLQKVKYFEETRYRHPQNGSQMIFLQEQRTQLVYEDIHTLYERKQFLETDLNMYKDIVTVLSDFSVPKKRVNGIGYYAKKMVPLLFFFTILILIILDNRKKIREVYNKY